MKINIVTLLLALIAVMAGLIAAQEPVAQLTVSFLFSFGSQGSQSVGKKLL